MGNRQRRGQVARQRFDTSFVVVACPENEFKPGAVFGKIEVEQGLRDMVWPNGMTFKRQGKRQVLTVKWKALVDEKGRPVTGKPLCSWQAAPCPGPCYKTYKYCLAHSKLMNQAGHRRRYGTRLCKCGQPAAKSSQNCPACQRKLHLAKLARCAAYRRRRRAELGWRA